jgi:UDP-N-acetylmuramate--alanine ligase
MSLDNIHSVYFVGAGGIGMSAIARYFNARGLFVAGYDKTATPLTDQLQAEGISLHFEDSVELIPNQIKNGEKDQVLVVYTPAIPQNHSELTFFQKEGFTILKRSGVLGLITENSFSVAVAGTHGKTTTSVLISHILRETGYDCNAFLGGIASNYNSNVLLSEESDTTVVEADEYDRSFLTLYPNIAIITSMDADHLDIYGDKGALAESFHLFTDHIAPEGLLIYRKGLDVEHNQMLSYSITEEADIYAENIHVSDGTFKYDVRSSKGDLKNIQLGLPGKHNIENSIAAIAVAQELGIDNEKIKGALENFAGVKRRFEYQVKTPDLVYIDDYAHHPEELKACISSVKELYPNKKITGIFQPHLFTRTRDFADEFAQSLELLGELILLEIYPARELPIAGVDSRMLLNKVNLEHKMVCSKKEVIENIRDRELEVLLTLGAGDIDQLVNPIKEELLKKTETIG